MPQPKKHSTNALRQAAYRKRCAQVAILRPPSQVTPGKPAASRLSVKPGPRRWEVLLQQAQLAVDATAEEMEEYYEERSEKWQEDERGEAFMQRLEAVQEITAAFDQLP